MQILIIRSLTSIFKLFITVGFKDFYYSINCGYNFMFTSVLNTAIYVQFFRVWVGSNILKIYSIFGLFRLNTQSRAIFHRSSFRSSPQRNLAFHYSHEQAVTGTWKRPGSFREIAVLSMFSRFNISSGICRSLVKIFLVYAKICRRNILSRLRILRFYYEWLDIF